jgi:hypothetical protein
MTSWVAAQRLVVATEEATERRKHDADRVKAPCSIRGTLQMGTPHAVAPTSEATISIPDIWWRSLFYKIYFPLHWWTDEVIQQYHDRPHSIPKCDITLENGTKVQVVDFPRAEEMLGDEEATFERLTPGLWRQASSNLLAAYDICCTPAAEGESEVEINYNTVFRQHTHFFTRLKCIEDLKMFSVWYPVENELRNEVYNGGGFSLATWENRWMIALAAWKQANASTPFTPSRSASPFNSSSSLGVPNRNGKRTSPDDGNTAAAKRRERSSTPTSGDGQSFRKPPACVTCCGPHSAYDHPTTITAFLDGKPIFSIIVGRDIRTARAFRGNAPKSLCLNFNLGRKCNGEHGDEWIHACSLCGGDHGALSRDPACLRVRDGAFVP